MTVRDNLMMGHFRGPTRRLCGLLRRRAASVPRLHDRLREAAGTLSGGEQQMLVVGRALMAKPRLLLLDEPSLGVAPKIVQDIARSIVAINRDQKVSVPPGRAEFAHGAPGFAPRLCARDRIGRAFRTVR